MPIFKITVRATGQAALVRARCIQCARTVAVENAGAEGAHVWRDNALSSVELVREDGKPELILRSGNE